MKIIKSIIIYLIIMTTLISKWFCDGVIPSTDSYFPFSGTTLPNAASPIEIDIPKIITWDIADQENGINGLLNVFMPNHEMYDGWEWPSVLFYLKTIVNLLLSFVSLIALILMIYAFYMIFLKKDEAGITTAKQIIKGVIIALFVIWLSRIVVSFLFRFENKNTENVWTQTWYNNDTQIVSSLT